MANTRSAKKAARQTIKRTKVNKARVDYQLSFIREFYGVR